MTRTDPALLVLVMLVSRNVFHVVSALQSIAYISTCTQNRYGFPIILLAVVGLK